MWGTVGIGGCCDSIDWVLQRNRLRWSCVKNGWWWHSAKVNDWTTCTGELFTAEWARSYCVQTGLWSAVPCQYQPSHNAVIASQSYVTTVDRYCLMMMMFTMTMFTVLSSWQNDWIVREEDLLAYLQQLLNSWIEQYNAIQSIKWIKQVRTNIQTVQCDKNNISINAKS